MQLTSKHIHDFIEALPGANVQQYCRLLAISPQRLNKFLSEDRRGKKLVKQKKVKGPMKGRMPEWAGYDTERGVLTAQNVNLSANGALQRILKTLPAEYRSDAEHMFKMVIQMSSGNITFEDALGELTGPYTNLAASHASQSGELLALRDLNSELRESVALLQEVRKLTASEVLRLPNPDSQTAEAGSEDTASA